MAGKLVHFEFPVKDADGAKKFYSDVFGWQFGDTAMPGIEYYMVQTGEDQGGAVYPAESGEKGPVIYFDTDDIDGSVTKVRDAGGEAEDKQSIPGIGWFARCKDPEGTPFSLYQSDESAPPPSQ